MLINLRRELRLRLRQTVVLSAGLGIAVGAGLLTTAGPASAAPAAAGHAAVRASQIGLGGRGCQIKIPSRGVGPVRGRCCPPRVRKVPGRSIRPIRPIQRIRPIRGLCCPVPVRVPVRTDRPVTVKCGPVPGPPPGRLCKVRVSAGGGVRLRPVPVRPVRCRINVKVGQGS